MPPIIRSEDLSSSQSIPTSSSGTVFEGMALVVSVLTLIAMVVRWWRENRNPVQQLIELDATSLEVCSKSFESAR
ncbi:hypothetical protein K504DRAFT_135248 [Pleomassaria siparia CBS 279.74]|uniref:Uncharacterized protein n=1 Tax=Pleomassaria siparia CBS 279.74 TaxID=1314801 RepID=A0A6G1KL20_9PLEO|nr:hypothetical protein K504DRAFT_135248 [Pleomassaria siparia CBS 279.74]